MEIEQLKAQSKDFVERVWKFTGERNQQGDLYEGAALNVINYGNKVRVFVENSGRELTNLQVDKTTPVGNYNDFRIVEVRKTGNMVDSIKVLACELPNTAANTQEEKDPKSLYYMLGGLGILIGISGWLLYKKGH